MPAFENELPVVEIIFPVPQIMISANCGDSFFSSFFCSSNCDRFIIFFFKILWMYCKDKKVVCRLDREHEREIALPSPM